MDSDLRGDFSRLRFDPRKNYTAVLQQQGRVALDADANELAAIEDYLRSTETIDMIGATGGPVHDEGFAISIDGGAIEIGKGRYYVNGILCEQFHPTPYADQQPFLIDPHPTDKDLLQDLAKGSIDHIQVYLEAWRRLVTALDDPCLRERALGQADTTARLQTVFRVVAKGVKGGATTPGGADCCGSMHTEVLPAPSTGKLTAKTSTSDDCGCQPVAPAGYSGLENQLYRVEIHHGGTEATATCKWSRENGSVVVAVTGVSGKQVYVESLGPDVNLGFAVGQWVEIYDDSDMFGEQPNKPGELYQIQAINAAALTVTVATTVAFVDATRNARMRRWDHSGAAAVADGLSLSPGPLMLENGIEVEFAKGSYAPGDYWLIPARTAAGEIEWPPCNGDGALAQPPSRTAVYVAPLACISMQDNLPSVRDCRKKFYPLTELSPSKTSNCCTYRVGDGVTTFGDYNSIQHALDKLPKEGGEICLLPGLHYGNVRIIDRHDVVIHGCGWQTRVASLSRKPKNASRDPFPVSIDGETGALNPFDAVFTIAASHHVLLRGFAVEAADDEVGILIDGTETTLSTDRAAALALRVDRLRGVIDIAVENLVITAAALPAILAAKVQLLRIDRNRVAMDDARSKWPAIYVSGTEIHIDGNWVGIQSVGNDAMWLPAIVTDDLIAAARSDDTATIANAASALREFALHPGGIQVGGNSTSVYIVDNEIEGGSGNGITLGSYDVLDARGGVTGIWTGMWPNGEGDACDCGGSLQTPTGYDPVPGSRLVAGGLLTDIQIHRNRIRKTGLCGIGPVGFFDLTVDLEIITTRISCITQNQITDTLLRDLAPIDVARQSGELVATVMAYGAICIPDVIDLTIKDNAITLFGARPGVAVCGIFVLHGEVIEIGGNQVIDDRDWALAGSEQAPAASFARGGIVILFATPPPLRSAAALAPARSEALAQPQELREAPVFEPGIPAVRLDRNIVRTPLSCALEIIGLGPFAIVDNQFSCGGRVTPDGPGLPQTVLIVNLGAAIDAGSAVALPGRPSIGADTAVATASGGSGAGGAVLFTDNICQLEASASRQKDVASVWIATADHLIFSNNHCWLDAAHPSVAIDAVLLARTLNVVGNRFQESLLALRHEKQSPNAHVSALTIGTAVNVTGQNIATFCIVVLGHLKSDHANLSPNCTPRLKTRLETALNKLF